MAAEAGDGTAIPNGTEQSITSAAQVTVTPVTSQPVETVVTGPASLESAAVNAAASNPEWLLTVISVLGGVLLLFGLWFVAFCTIRWVDGNNAHAGDILHGLAGPLTALAIAFVAYIVGLFQAPPKRSS
jgi:ABC-type uncharacterized transport system permease subunit